MATAEELKQHGNKAFAQGDHPTAIKHFTDAIALDPSNHVLFSNRSASQCSLKNYQDALQDADKCISLKPDWAKGYGRKGAALLGLRKFREAEAAYKEGLKLEPNNDQLKKGLSDVHDIGGREGMSAMSQVFNDPKTIEKLKNSPKTRDLMSQPDFMAMLGQIQQNPQNLQAFLSDPRMVQALSVVLGIDAEADMEVDPQVPTEPKKEEPKKEEPKKEEPKKEEPKKEEPKKEEPKEEPAAADDDDLPKVSGDDQKKAEQEKELGTQLYKQRKFDEALQHYSKAWELNPRNIVYLNNKAAVLFEKGDFDNCIKTCEMAVDEGRRLRADYQHIAKAYARMGNAHFKQDRLDEATTFYKKSLAEHRSADVLNKLREAEKALEKKARQAYINPQLAEEEREKGNACFKSQDFAGAVKHYTEATKRSPDDAKIFSNRAAAYTKLMALPEALKDCQEALRLDPKFIKAYIRKAHVEVAMKKFSEALSTLDEAKNLDTEGAHMNEIRDIQMKCLGGSSNMSEADVAENAKRDPEVIQIMQDPVMRSILDQMQTDPKAAQEHLKNPVVAKKIQKLIDVGVIRMGR